MWGTQTASCSGWPTEPQRFGCKQQYLKVELCRNFIENSYCQYGDRCCFAHGYTELSTAAIEKLRTKPCRLFHEKSACKYGCRCNFQHQTKPLHSVVGEAKRTHRANILDWYPEILLEGGGASRLFN
jgi:hypothetical protein